MNFGNCARAAHQGKWANRSPRISKGQAEIVVFHLRSEQYCESVVKRKRDRSGDPQPAEKRNLEVRRQLVLPIAMSSTPVWHFESAGSFSQEVVDEALKCIGLLTFLLISVNIVNQDAHPQKPRTVVPAIPKTWDDEIGAISIPQGSSNSDQSSI
jgi:hypothetical protein